MAELIKPEGKLNSEFLAKAVVRLMKQDILKKFIETSALSEEDQEFCDNIDWYPIDELELKEEYAEKLRLQIKEPIGKSMTPEEFNNWCESS